jgi:hypothetical protein
MIVNRYRGPVGAPAMGEDSRAFWSAVRTSVLGHNGALADHFDIAVRACGLTFRFDFGIGRNLVIFGGKPPVTRRQSVCLTSSQYALDWACVILGGTYDVNLLLHAEGGAARLGRMNFAGDSAAEVSVFNNVRSAAAFLLDLPDSTDD